MDSRPRDAQLLTSPVGCALLLVIEQRELSVTAVAKDLDLGLSVIGAAADVVTPWSGDHADMIAHVLSEGPRLATLAAHLVAQPGIADWRRPVQRPAQLWIGIEGWPFDLDRDFSGSNDNRDHFSWFRTSDVVGDLSSELIAARERVGDYFPRPPHTRCRLAVSETASVCEIQTAADWAALCRTFPAPDDDGRLDLDWRAAATAYDGIHFTPWSVLTAEQVRINGDAGWTELRYHVTENTAWLRPCFDEIEPLVPLDELPESPYDLGYYYWDPKWDDDPQPWRAILSR